MDSLKKGKISEYQQEQARSLISKTTGVDYNRLRDLLEAGKWQEADRETKRMMLKAAGREKEGWFRREDLNKFSCEDLSIIDQLWVESSQGKFGFSVQKEIWQSNGSSTKDTPLKVWRKYYIDVGWKTEESGVSTSSGFISYSDLGGFNDLDTSRVGNLPFSVTLPNENHFWRRFGCSSLLTRVANYNLQRHKDFR